MTTQAPYTHNRATLPKEEINNARNYTGEKEEVERIRFVVFDAKAERSEYDRSDVRFREVVDARFWMGRSSSASTVYCSIWVRTRDGRWLSGRGQAGGYGYHKASAALEAAIDSAGIKMAAHFGGAGEQAMRHAVEAIGRAAGYARTPGTVL